ncbi:hypothetical protein D3C73_1210190 [compost metagenome]
MVAGLPFHGFQAARQFNNDPVRSECRRSQKVPHAGVAGRCGGEVKRHGHVVRDVVRCRQGAVQRGNFEFRSQSGCRSLVEPDIGSGPVLTHEPGQRLHAHHLAARQCMDRLEGCQQEFVRQDRLDAFTDFVADGYRYCPGCIRGLQVQAGNFTLNGDLGR